MKTETLASFIKKECADYAGGRMCRGIGLTNIKGLEPVLAPKAGKCIVLEAQRKRIDERTRCNYFEKCLLPLIKMGMVQYADACQEYRELYAANTIASVKEIRKCGCGAPLGPKRRMCDKCRKKQEKKNKRERQTRWRKNKVSV